MEWTAWFVFTASPCLQIWVVASNRRTTRPREGASWPIYTMNLQYICRSDKGFSDSWSHSFGNLFTDHVVLYYMKRLCHPPSDICHITRRRRKGKSLEVSCKLVVSLGLGYLKAQAQVTGRPSVFHKSPVHTSSVRLTILLY